MKSNIFLILLILIIVTLSSCIGQDKEKDQENKSTVTVIDTILPTLTTSISTQIPTSTSTSVPTGITYKEQIRNNPPYPRNLTGAFKENYIELRWDTPEKVELPHNYNDIIIRYNIYKGTREDDIRYLTSTTERMFLDINVSDSSKYIYEITAVHKGEVESLPSEDVTVTK